MPRSEGEAWPAVPFARRLYDDVLGWYASADTKAQVVLGIDGAFVAFLTSQVFVKPSDLVAIVEPFSRSIWILLGLMTACLLVSVGSAIYCLWSRIYSTKQLALLIQAAQQRHADPGVYAPEVMWFFQMITELDPSKFERTLQAVDGDVETKVLASQVWILSRNVRRKHMAANLGFGFTACTLVLFFAAGIGHLIEVI